ncbi:MAG: hypothetical protein IKX56_08080 [Muribaculaceae bacterium]|nr:hypothetical protein [Muribaculaceae bacterium]
MRWTCPKCGKKLDISNEQLIANDGVIVCPQCLLQSRQPIPTSRVAARLDEAAAATPPPHRQSAKTASTPPPPKPRMKQARTSYRYTGMSSTSAQGNGTSRPASTRKTTKKKSRKKKKNDGMSAWGCLGRTVVFTLVLFALYVFFGLLLEALQ